MVITFKDASRGNLTYIIEGGGYRTYNMLYITTPYQNVMRSDLHRGNDGRGFRICKFKRNDNTK